MRLGLGFGLNRPTGAGFTPRSLFTATTQGAIYDYDDFSYLYQKADGSVPVTALEQPVGLMLDKRWGGARGSELVTNGDFSGGGAGWTKNESGSSTVTFSGGAVRLLCVSAPDACGITQAPGGTVGAWYAVTVTATVASGSFYLSFGSAAAGVSRVNVSTSGTFTFFVQRGSTDALFRVNRVAVCDVTVDSISVRELHGLHAYQSTDAARPVLSARYNLLLNTATLSTQSVTTLAASYTLTFTGSGTVTLSGTATGVKSAGTNVFTATAGTLTLTVSGSVTLADLRLTADANSRLPAYQRVTTATDYDSAGFPRFLRQDATDDFMQTAAVDPGTDKVFVCAGVTKASDAAAAILLESSTNAATTNGAFYLSAPNYAAANFAMVSRGTLAATPLASGNAAPMTAVLSGTGDISGDSAILRVNNAVGGTATGDQGTGNYTAQPLYIGARAGTSLRLNNGRIYPMVICFKAVTAGEIAAVEAWVNARTRAY